jgi:hypothetical protein
LRRPCLCPIWSLDGSSTGMSLGTPSNMRSTTLKHLRRLENSHG